jgi:hypothetical protein
MPVLYVVLSQRPEMDARLEEAVKAAFPGNFFQISERGQWLVVGEGTAREISNKIGITGTEPDQAKIGTSIVFAVSGYFGRASSELWEWVAVKLGGHIIA